MKLLAWTVALGLAGCLIVSDAQTSTAESAVQVSLLQFSGRPNPSFELTAPGDLETLAAFFSDLPATSPPAWAGSAFGGFELFHSDFAILTRHRIPPLARVLQGVIEIGSKYFEDVHDLEGWLQERLPLQ